MDFVNEACLAQRGEVEVDDKFDILMDTIPTNRGKCFESALSKFIVSKSVDCDDSGGNKKGFDYRFVDSEGKDVFFELKWATRWTYNKKGKLVPNSWKQTPRRADKSKYYILATFDMECKNIIFYLVGKDEIIQENMNVSVLHRTDTGHIELGALTMGKRTLRYFEEHNCLCGDEYQLIDRIKELLNI